MCFQTHPLIIEIDIRRFTGHPRREKYSHSLLVQEQVVTEICSIEIFEQKAVMAFKNYHYKRAEVFTSSLFSLLYKFFCPLVGLLFDKFLRYFFDRIQDL
jgi:hypothetical protein